MMIEVFLIIYVVVASSLMAAHYTFTPMKVHEALAILLWPVLLVFLLVTNLVKALIAAYSKNDHER